MRMRKLQRIDNPSVWKDQTVLWMLQLLWAGSTQYWNPRAKWDQAERCFLMCGLSLVQFSTTLSFTQCGEKLRRTESYTNKTTGRQPNGKLELDIPRIRQRQKEVGLSGSVYIPPGPHHFQTDHPGIGEALIWAAEADHSGIGEAHIKREANPRLGPYEGGLQGPPRAPLEPKPQVPLGGLQG